jgi:lipopolysaccharide/colanic/teichoic acid biosynthesis glycosyltransferase
MKRLFDVVVAATGLLLLAPVFVAIAAWIKLDSPGPIFFRQQRVCRFGRLFRIHKFRTMVVDAPARGPAITAGGDRRITRSGRFLRHYKLDELPQLLDVLAGTMSLVGPRPEVPQYVELYPPATRALILSIRPGITDEAALLFRDESELLGRSADPHTTYVQEILPRKLALYESYVRHRSFTGDVAIIWRTITRVFAGRTTEG